MAGTAGGTEVGVGMVNEGQFDTEVAVEKDHIVVPISSCLAVVAAGKMAHEVHCFLSSAEEETLEAEVAQELSR